MGAHEIVFLDPLHDILLDPNNPRISPEDRTEDQPGLLAHLILNFKVEELATAISVAGYLPMDPLVGYRHEGKVYVREGNRRIASIKAIRSPELVPASRKERFLSIRNNMEKERLESLGRVAIDVYEDIKDASVESYVGFRHVTGPLQWKPEERARYIAEMIVSHGWSFKDIAERIGSYPRHVERLFVCFSVIEQAKSKGIPGAERIKIGVLTRAFQIPSVLSFLSLDYSGDTGLAASPIKNDNLVAFQEFLKWLFGTNDSPPLFTDSRELTSFGKILSSTEALIYLRDSKDPDYEIAKRRALAEREIVKTNLTRAAQLVEETIGVIPDYASDKAVQELALRCGKRIVALSRDIDSLKDYLIEWAKNAPNVGGK